MAWADAEVIERVLQNIVGNAIKFTTSGAIHIRLICVDDAHWAITVRDTGSGILPEEQAYIFEAFWQAEKDAQVKDSLGKIDHKFLVMSGKGGVGKSSIAASLAVALSSQRIICGDCDVDASNLSLVLGAREVVACYGSGDELFGRVVQHLGRHGLDPASCYPLQTL